ncbi:signal peptidase II [Coxiella endosymbiont of Amblyomma americanum]|uniref:signal peptidase II n=1 Tax=Coxiella endosymbiont of Amblyomma americanum TaxID=325775 RepID=UPI00057F1EDC|nr:signal peptidase II [Coxiella endosymbiont of Amblyomma americanum]AJC50487.1 signal peptidase II Aspartic peptidase MEROPS family A08 [Coxiella endosymbiont of Amblyomma americanum]AUJ58825.1 signal peptidase II [Coxiella-like endosymbiont of Amblyomma americanum]
MKRAREKKVTSVWLRASVYVVIADQLTKYLAVYFLTYGIPVKILPWLNLTLRYNTGTAFGFFFTVGKRHPYFFFLILLIVSALFITIWLGQIKYSNKWRDFWIALVIGGTFGNFLDRIRFGYVIDFIDFHIKHWHYAVFNIADCTICIGGFLLIVSLLTSYGFLE